MFNAYDRRYDTATPTPELIKEFTDGLGSAMKEARAAGAAIAALREYGAEYLTREEVRLVSKYGRRSERAAVEGQPR